MSKVIVLASGGLDSSLVMAKLLKKRHEVFPLFSNYNQYALENERKAVHAVRDWLYARTTQGDDLGLGFPGHLMDVVEVHIDAGIGQIAACPGRVLSFVGAACIWAFTNKWDKGEIAIGIHKGDKDQDSCRVGYEDALDAALVSLTQGCMRITTPLMGMTREDMAKEIVDIGIPFEIMYNCYWGVPCGWQSMNMGYLCPGCRRKKEAMDIAWGNGITSTYHGPNVPTMGSNVTRRDWTKWI